MALVALVKQTIEEKVIALVFLSFIAFALRELRCIINILNNFIFRYITTYAFLPETD